MASTAAATSTIQRTARVIGLSSTAFLASSVVVVAYTNGTPSLLCSSNNDGKTKEDQTFEKTQTITTTTSSPSLISRSSTQQTSTTPTNMIMIPYTFLSSIISDGSSNNNIIMDKVIPLTKQSWKDIKIGMNVTYRFLDILSRSAWVVADYKLHQYLHVKPPPSSSSSPDDEFDNGPNVNHSSSSNVNTEQLLTRSLSSSSSTDKKTKNHLDQVHQRAAQSLYTACSKHGGLLVKLGQYISTNMGGFVPSVYIDALTPLQDSCSPLEYDELMNVIQEELKDDDGEILDHVERIPLGSASLAQVHLGHLKDGRVVAIKVQRPGLEWSTSVDFVAIRLLSRVVEYCFPGSGFDWMLPEFEKSIAAELDFTQEAMNAERCRKMLHGTPLTTDTSLWDVWSHYFWGGSSSSTRKGGPPNAIVPVMMHDLTTSKMLIMSYEEGFKITNTKLLQKHNINPHKVASATCALFAELVHVHGFVHADPHPGNILVRPRHSSSDKEGEFDLVLLDHGMYRRLDESFRSSYSHLWTGLVSDNTEMALRGMRGLGLNDSYLDLLGVMLTYRIPSSSTQKLGSLLGKESRQKLRSDLKSKYGDELFSASKINEFFESTPRDLLFCLRCMNLVRGVNRELGGSTLDRLTAFGTAASRACRMESSLWDVDDEIRMMLFDHEKEVKKKEEGSGGSSVDHLAHAKAALNVPVASELWSISNKNATSGNGKVQQQKEVTKRLMAKTTTTTIAATRLPGNEQQEEGMDLCHPMVPRTLHDVMESFKISFRIWIRSVLLDAILYWKGAKLDVSPRQLG